MAEEPSPEAVAFVHGVIRDFPGAGAILGAEIDQLSAEQLLAYYVLTHHYCRDGVVRAAAGSILTAPKGWAALSDKADQIVRGELVSDAAFARCSMALRVSQLSSPHC